MPDVDHGIAGKAWTPLLRSQVPIDALALGRFLLGKTLVRRHGAETLSGRIVETESYLDDDPASHSFKGETRRNRAMFLRRGHAYVYRIYGMWFCLNVSAGKVGAGSAVLLRAIEPISGMEVMTRNRSGAKLTDLARGPGRLCAAFAIEARHSGLDLCAQSELFLAPGDKRPFSIGESPRIGITRAGERLWRFYERGSRFVSGSAALRL